MAARQPVARDREGQVEEGERDPEREDAAVRAERAGGGDNDDQRREAHGG